jgi:deoxyhypusine synthase
MECYILDSRQETAESVQAWDNMLKEEKLTVMMGLTGAMGQQA